MTRKEFFKIISNYQFTQQVRKKLVLSSTQAYMLIYFASHEPCSKLRDTIIDELGIVKNTYLENMKVLFDLDLINIERQWNNRNHITLNYERLSLILDDKLSVYPRRERIARVVKERQFASKTINKVSESDTFIKELGSFNEPEVVPIFDHSKPTIGSFNEPEVVPINEPYIDTLINNLEPIDNLIDTPSTSPQKAKVKKTRVKKDIGEERKTFYDTLIKRYFEILNTYTAPNFEADKISLPSDLEAIVNKRRAKPIITPEGKEIPPLSTLEDWDAFIHKALSDDHKTGRNGKEWPCGLSWCIRKDENFAKIVATRPKESGRVIDIKAASFENVKDKLKGKNPFGDNKKIVDMKKDETGGGYVAR